MSEHMCDKSKHVVMFRVKSEKRTVSLHAIPCVCVAHNLHQLNENGGDNHPTASL